MQYGSVLHMHNQPHGPRILQMCKKLTNKITGLSKKVVQKLETVRISLQEELTSRYRYLDNDGAKPTVQIYLADTSSIRDPHVK